MARKSNPEAAAAPAKAPAKKAEKKAEKKESAKKPAAPEIIVSKAVGTVLIANRHAGGIVFPRRGEGGIAMPPLRLAPGTVTQVDAEEWKRRRGNTLVQHYLDAGLIAEVRRAEPITALSEKTADLQVPENLQTAAEQGSVAPSGASVTKENAGTVTIS